MTYESEFTANVTHHMFDIKTLRHWHEEKEKMDEIFGRELQNSVPVFIVSRWASSLNEDTVLMKQ